MPKASEPHAPYGEFWHSAYLRHGAQARTWREQLIEAMRAASNRSASLWSIDGRAADCPLYRARLAVYDAVREHAPARDVELKLFEMKLIYKAHGVEL